jgi:hypothetical protein
VHYIVGLLSLISSPPFVFVETVVCDTIRKYLGKEAMRLLSRCDMFGLFTGDARHQALKNEEGPVSANTASIYAALILRGEVSPQSILTETQEILLIPSHFEGKTCPIAWKCLMCCRCSFCTLRIAR